MAPAPWNRAAKCTATPPREELVNRLADFQFPRLRPLSLWERIRVRAFPASPMHCRTNGELVNRFADFPVGRRPGRSHSPGHRPGGRRAFCQSIGPTGQAEQLARWADNAGSIGPASPGRRPCLSHTIMISRGDRPIHPTYTPPQLSLGVCVVRETSNGVQRPPFGRTTDSQRAVPQCGGLTACLVRDEQLGRSFSVRRDRVSHRESVGRYRGVTTAACLRLSFRPDVTYDGGATRDIGRYSFGVHRFRLGISTAVATFSPKRWSQATSGGALTADEEDATLI